MRRSWRRQSSTPRSSRAAAARGDAAHEREEALLALHADHDAAAALQLARAQLRAPEDTADLRLLVEGRGAAGDRAALERRATGCEASGFEDRVVAAQLAGAQS